MRLPIAIALLSSACSAAEVPSATPPAAPSPTIATATMVVHHGVAPDDGPGYRIGIGESPASPDACRLPQRQPRPREFAQGPYTVIGLATTARTPSTIRLETELGEASWCSADDHCEIALGGVVALDSITDTRIEGHYAIDFPHGAVTGELHAVWCDPAPPPRRGLAVPAQALAGFDAHAHEGQHVRMRGLLAARGGVVLADALCETSPPKPCGVQLPLVAPQPALTERFLVHSAGADTTAIRWSDPGIVVDGIVAKGQLVVSSIAAE